MVVVMRGGAVVMAMACEVMVAGKGGLDVW